LYDPQTSGGLLIALPERDAALLEKKMPDAYRIGHVTELKSKPIRLL
jgi:selenide,water dikinase